MSDPEAEREARRGQPRVNAHPGLSFDVTGAPQDPEFGDVFRSRRDAWAEANTVFIEGCRVHEAWRDREQFTVLELGFGLGVNFLATLAAWRADPQRCRRLNFVSIESRPVSREDLRRGLEALAQAASGLGSNGIVSRAEHSEHSEPTEPDRRSAHPEDLVRLIAQWPLPLPGLHRLYFAEGAVSLTLALGDAGAMVPQLALVADAVFLDGFSPDRNPAMWTPRLLKAVGRLARRGARLATWSAAGAVREALGEAGFEVSRLPGHRGKRDRIEAVFDPRWRHGSVRYSPAPPRERRVMVIGAGLAGAAVARGFARRGFSVDLLDSGARPGGMGSAQPLVAEHVHLSPDDNRLARLSRAALLLRKARAGEQASQGTWATVQGPGATVQGPGAPVRGPGISMRGPEASGQGSAVAMQVEGRGLKVQGRLELAADEADEAAQRALLDRLGFPEDFLRRLTPSEASDCAGIALPRGGLWLPDCEAIAPDLSIRRWIAEAGEALRFRPRARVATLERTHGTWIARSAEGTVLASASSAVLACAGEAPRLGALASASMRRVRGQSTWLREPSLARLRVILGGDAYAVPAGDGERLLLGSSFDERDSLMPDPDDDLANLLRFGGTLDHPTENLREQIEPAAVGWRWVLSDRLPAIGALPDEAAAGAIAHELSRNDRLPIPIAEGLYGAFGFGSRGLLWAALAAELLPALVCGEPAPVERELIDAVAPARFLRRRLRKQG